MVELIMLSSNYHTCQIKFSTEIFKGIVPWDFLLTFTLNMTIFPKFRKIIPHTFLLVAEFNANYIFMMEENYLFFNHKTH